MVGSCKHVTDYSLRIVFVVTVVTVIIYLGRIILCRISTCFVHMNLDMISMFHPISMFITANL